MAIKKLTEHLTNLPSCHSNIKAVEASVIKLHCFSWELLKPGLLCHKALKAGEEQSGTCMACGAAVLKGDSAPCSASHRSEIVAPFFLE